MKADGSDIFIKLEQNISSLCHFRQTFAAHYEKSLENTETKLHVQPTLIFNNTVSHELSDSVQSVFILLNVKDILHTIMGL